MRRLGVQKIAVAAVLVAIILGATSAMNLESSDQSSDQPSEQGLFQSVPEELAHALDQPLGNLDGVLMASGNASDREGWEKDRGESRASGGESGSLGSPDGNSADGGQGAGSSVGGGQGAGSPAGGGQGDGSLAGGGQGDGSPANNGQGDGSSVGGPGGGNPAGGGQGDGNPGDGGSGGGNPADGGSDGGDAAGDVDRKVTCTVEIRCDSISGKGILTANGYPQLESYAANPVILGAASISLDEGSSAYDALYQACRDNGIQIESSYSPGYGSYYIEGINHLYEFQAGPGSGWTYEVNGTSPNYGSSSYVLKEGDKVVWRYTCGSDG